MTLTLGHYVNVKFISAFTEQERKDVGVSAFYWINKSTRAAVLSKSKSCSLHCIRESANVSIGVLAERPLFSNGYDWLIDQRSPTTSTVKCTRANVFSVLRIE